MGRKAGGESSGFSVFVYKNKRKKRKGNPLYGGGHRGRSPPLAMLGGSAGHSPVTAAPVHRCQGGDATPARLGCCCFFL